jgi:hypothetical protein
MNGQRVIYLGLHNERDCANDRDKNPDWLNQAAAFDPHTIQKQTFLESMKAPLGRPPESITCSGFFAGIWAVT